MVSGNDPSDINIRSPRFFLARTAAKCHHCGESTPLFALAVPPAHEVLELDPEEQNEDRTADSWSVAPHSALLFFINGLPDLLKARIRQFTPSYGLGSREATEASYWANQCQHCDSLFDDNELFCEPGGAFQPLSEVSARRIHLLAIDEEFKAAAAGYALDPPFFDAMTLD